MSGKEMERIQKTAAQYIQPSSADFIYCGVYRGDCVAGDGVADAEQAG